MGDEVCSDTGPILHLHEIKRKDLFSIFNKVYISDAVLKELDRYSIFELPNNFKTEKVNAEQVVLLAHRYMLGLGESSILWLCLSLRRLILLTDDLEVRDVATILGIRPVGTIGIILRAMREKIISKQKAKDIVVNLPVISSLFITKQLINFAIDEIDKFTD